MSVAQRPSSLIAPQTLSPAQRWDRICQAVGEVHSARTKRAQAQTEAADYLAGEAHDIACDRLMMLVLAPEAVPMMDEVRGFLNVTYGGRI